MCTNYLFCTTSTSTAKVIQAWKTCVFINVNSLDVPCASPQNQAGTWKNEAQSSGRQLKCMQKLTYFHFMSANTSATIQLLHSLLCISIKWEWITIANGIECIHSIVNVWFTLYELDIWHCQHFEYRFRLWNSAHRFQIFRNSQYPWAHWYRFHINWYRV